MYLAVTEEDKKHYFKEEFKGDVPLTPVKFPKELGEEHPFDFEDAERVMKSVGIINGTINKIADNIVGEFSIKCKDKNASKIIDDFLHNTNFKTTIKQWIMEALSKGNGFMELDLDNGKIRVDNAKYMYVQRDSKGNILGYNQFLTNDYKKFSISSRKFTSFLPKEIAHLKINAIPGEAYGQGILIPNEHIVENMVTNEMDMQKLISRKAGAPIHVQVGPPGENTDPVVVDNIKSNLLYMTNRTEWVTDGNVKMDVLQFGEIGRNLIDNLDHNIEVLAAGMQVPVVLMGKGRIPEGLAKYQTETFLRMINSIQDEIESVIEEKVLKPILEINGKTNIDVDFVWNLPGEEQIIARLDKLNLILQNPFLTQELRNEIQIEVARLLNIDNPEELISKSLETEAKNKAEKANEEKIPQPEVPGVKNQSAELELKEYVRKVGDEWCVFSHQTGKNFGCYKTKAEAEDRLAQIKRFKDDAEICPNCNHKHTDEKEINNIEEFGEMTIKEFVNLKEISGFNYSDYLSNILKALKEDNFNELKAITEKDIENGLLNSEQIEKLRQILKDGFKKNKSISMIESEIRDNLGLTDRIKEDGSTIPASSRPNMISRTETVRLANEGLIKTYKENDIKKVSFLAALSDRTCPTCEALNGQVFEISNLNVGENQPPIHTACRCSLLSVTE